MRQRVLSLLGMCRRAGKLASGDTATRQAIARGAARLVVVASDAGSSTKRSFDRLSENAGVPCIVFGSREELGQAVGSGPKAVLGVLDEGLAGAVSRAASGRPGGSGGSHSMGVD